MASVNRRRQSNVMLTNRDYCLCKRLLNDNGARPSADVTR